jgi:gas vesicle protein
MAERQRSADDIRQEIERTRAGMDQTVEAIGQRLTPGQIVDDIWGRMRHTDAPSVIGDAVREHPLPLALVGAGLAWLAYDRMSETEGERLRRKYGDIGPGTYEPAEGRAGPYLGDELGFGEDENRGIGERVHGAADSVRNAASGVGSKVSDAASTVGSKVSEVASGARERVSGAASTVGDRATDARAWASDRAHRAGEAASRARERAGEMAGRARDGFGRTLDDQPLALGAVAFGLGIASGIVAPPSRWEDERLGRTADRIKDEARRTGHEAADSARRVASETREAVRDVVQPEQLKDEVTGRLKQVAQEARDTAKQVIRDSAEREGLAGEGLRDRARDAADRVRE